MLKKTFEAALRSAQPMSPESQGGQRAGSVLVISGRERGDPFSSARADGLWRGLAQVADVWRLVPSHAHSATPAANGRLLSMDGAQPFEAVAAALRIARPRHVVFTDPSSPCLDLDYPAGTLLVAAPARIDAETLDRLVQVAGRLSAVWVRSEGEARAIAHLEIPVMIVTDSFALAAPKPTKAEPSVLGLLIDAASDTVALDRFARHLPEAFARSGCSLVLCPAVHLAAMASAAAELPLVPVLTLDAVIERAGVCLVDATSSDAAFLAARAGLADRKVLFAGEAGIAVPDWDAGLRFDLAAQDAASALRSAPPSDREALGVMLAANCGFSIETDETSYNPWTRLYERNVGVATSAGLEGLVALVSRADGSPDKCLPNAWATVTPSADGGSARLRAVAVLPDGVEPEAIEVELFLFGHPIRRLGATGERSEETAGLISLSPDGSDEAEILYWGPSEGTSLQVGRKLFEAEPADLRPGRPATFRTQAAFPFNRDSLQVFPASGRSRKFTNFGPLTSLERVSSKRLSDMRDAYAGRTAWLIGNGPSVRLADLDRLADADQLCFAFNRFHLARNDTRLRPAFTVTGDEQMIEDFGQEIVDRSGGEVFVANAHAPRLSGDYCWVRQLSVFPSLFSKDAPLFVTPGGSSVFVAMQIGYFLGIRRWYLYGADFTFRFDRSKSSDAFRSATGEGNHFIQNYRSGRAWCPPSLESIMPAFLAARHLFEAEGGFVRNATRGGLMEVFERGDFDEVVASL